MVEVMTISPAGLQAPPRHAGLRDSVTTVVVSLDHRFSRTPDGRVWTDGPFPYSFFERYLTVFDSVRAVARIRDIPHVVGDEKQACGDRVTFCPIPYYVGGLDYLKNRGGVRRAVAVAIGADDTVILRVPG